MFTRSLSLLVCFKCANVTAVAGACFGSTYRCTIADAIERSNLPSLSAISSTSSLAPASDHSSPFDPIAFIHSVCNILQRIEFNNVDVERVVVAVARIGTAVAADALARDTFLSTFSTSCFFSRSFYCNLHSTVPFSSLSPLLILLCLTL